MKLVYFRSLQIVASELIVYLFPCIVIGLVIFRSIICETKSGSTGFKVSNEAGHQVIAEVMLKRLDIISPESI